MYVLHERATLPSHLRVVCRHYLGPDLLETPLNQQQSLHPNLARIAAVYDDIVLRFSRGEINAADARGQILALMARDDNGTMWSIDPDTAQWRYQTLQGRLEFGEPPLSGLATPTAFDLTRDSRANNPDGNISFYQVDESLTNPPTSLVGSTRRPQARAPQSVKDKALGLADQYLETPVKKAIALLVVVVLLGLGIFALTSGRDPEPTPSVPSESGSVPAPSAPPAPAP